MDENNPQTTLPPAPSREGQRVLFGIGAATILLGIGAAMLPIARPASGGAVIGWLLLLAGTFELTGALVRGFEEVRAARVAAGSITGLTGLLLILNPLMDLFPTLYLVIAWLLIRGLVLLGVGYRSNRQMRAFIGISGLADLLLAAILIVGLPIAGFVVSVFGPTPELVAHFAWIFAASFLVTGLSLLLEPGLRRS